MSEYSVSTNPDYWDCECKYYYIHKKIRNEDGENDQTPCPICGVCESEQPDSRDDEIGIERAMYENRRITMEYNVDTKDRIVMRFDPNDDIYMKVNGITMKMDDSMFLSFSQDEADKFWNRLFIFVDEHYGE